MCESTPTLVQWRDPKTDNVRHIRRVVGRFVHRILITPGSTAHALVSFHSNQEVCLLDFHLLNCTDFLFMPVRSSFFVGPSISRDYLL
jgi:hypothetical protein